jgi:hypothetical protein
VKALACELPAKLGLPLSRFSRSELHRLVIERELTEAPASTIWRWLHDDALKPWQQRSWIFVRDPAFAEKAGRVLDLYGRRFQGRRLRPDEYVLCADEKLQLQALGPKHPPLPPAPGRAGRFEFDYQRNGTLAYFGRLGRPPRQPLRPRRRQDRQGAVRPARQPGDEQRAVCVGADRLLDRRQRLLARRQRLDRAHRGQPGRMRGRSTCRSTPPGSTRSSSTSRSSKRKALAPNDFDSLQALAERLLDFGDHYRQIARPFEWTFTRADLGRLLARIDAHTPDLTLAA